LTYELRRSCFLNHCVGCLLDQHGGGVAQQGGCRTCNFDG